MAVIRVLVVDDHSLVRKGVVETLTVDKGLEVVGEASNGEEGVAWAKELAPDVVLMDHDKPAGDDYERFEQVIESARRQRLLLQMGYMWRYHDGFSRISEWALSGFLGDVFSIRAHVSTNLSLQATSLLSAFDGGVFYDLGGHVIDQIVRILGRPEKVTTFLRRDSFATDGLKDNTLGVFEYDRAIATVDIAAMEPAPTARRFEVYGTAGSAIMEPFEPADTIRLCLREPKGDYPAGVSTIEIKDQPRYDAPLAAFLKDLRGEKEPDRTPEHELLVQETLLRATGAVRE